MNSRGVKRTLDRLAYASLFLDICIDAITGLTVLDARVTARLLLPADYLLSAVVAMSVVLFVLLIVMRSMERRSLEKGRGKKRLECPPTAASSCLFRSALGLSRRRQSPEAAMDRPVRFKGGVLT